MDKVLKSDIEYIAENLQEIFKILQNSTILVTGATGLVGSQIIKAILYYEIQNNITIRVIGIARNREKAKKAFGDLLEYKNFEMMYEDIQTLLEIDENIDYIIHGANTTISKEYVLKPVETIKTIINGTDNILRIAKNKRIKKMVYLSSMEIYGKTDNYSERIKECDLGYIDILNVRSSYSEGKRMAECLCSSYASEYNVPVVIARLAQVFGADVNIEDNRIFNQLAKSVINEENFVMHSKGESFGNYCYARDAVMAILILLFRGEIAEAYNVVNEDTSIKIYDMAKMVSEKISDSKMKIEIDLPKSQMTYGYAPDVTMKLSSEKINKLGWKSEISLENMYRRLIESIKERL